MLRPFSILIFLLITNLTFGQQNADFKTDSSITHFVNWKIKTYNEIDNVAKIRRVNQNVISWDSTDLELFFLNDFSILEQSLINMDSLLTKEDLNYMKQQMTSFIGQNDIWKKDDLDAKIIEPKPIDKIKKRRDFYWEYSFPIFSKDHSKCILKYNYICGILCASYRAVLYEKTSKGWIKIITLYNAES